MRARIDTRLGSWPAFWTLGTAIDRVGWPESGEVDIMEYYTGTVLANVCHGVGPKAEQRWSNVKQPQAQLGGDEWAEPLPTWANEGDDDSSAPVLHRVPDGRLAVA